jgi:hypothetical protein
VLQHSDSTTTDADVLADAPSWSSPSAKDRARAMRAAYKSAEDEHTRSLIRGLMDHYRGWCLERGLGDPFPSPRIVRRRALVTPR